MYDYVQWCILYNDVKNDDNDIIMIFRSKPSVSWTSDLWRLKANSIQDNAQFSGSIKVIVLIVMYISQSHNTSLHHLN